MTRTLLTQAREQAGLSITELARRAATSRPTLSADELGRVSPMLETAERILAVAGRSLQLGREPRWTELPVGRGRVASVPDVLPRLEPSAALATVELPLHVDCSSRDRTVDLSDRPRRLRAYEAILREGRPEDVEHLIDGVLLVDGWDDLVLPRAVRAAWQPVIDQARGHG